jgi:hypothetical protein
VLSGRQRPLRWADHSSSGVLPSVVCVSECDREATDNEEALAPLGAVAPTKIYVSHIL